MNFAYKISCKPFPGLRVKTFPVLIALAFTATQQLSAQISEDFSDGDFTYNPEWLGITDRFVVNEAFQLQLNAMAAGSSWLYTTLPPVTNEAMEWQFFVKQSFSSSASNFSRFYLTSDEPDLSAPLNGYYLQFGEAGSADAVELFRQAGRSVESVCRASTSGIAASFQIRVKVIQERDHWELQIDHSGGTNFSLEATGIGAPFPTRTYTGVLCTYTITNAARFYFDDITVRTINLPDTTRPQLRSVRATSARSMSIIFSEPVDPAATSLANYFVDNGPGYPASATLRDNNLTVELTFSQPFKNGEESRIRLEKIKDLAGNEIQPTEAVFIFFVQEPVYFKDIIVSEIFADPSPTVGLPESEFLEIYNRSGKPVQLSGWRLSDATSSAALDSFILLPGRYLVLTSPAAVNKFSPVQSVAGFPSLNNAGDNITLETAEGTPIDSLRYSSTWYRDADKADGGWSLELIDPTNICLAEHNWIASDAPAGGTPGEQNSAFATIPDNMGPMLTEIIPADSLTILLFFNERLDRQLPSVAEFAIDPEIQLFNVDFTDGHLKSIRLTFVEPLHRGKTYSITLGKIFDCAGNKIQNSFSRSAFILPEVANTGDLIVNEILFNPRPNAVDFVEIYNRSPKVVDIRNWKIRNDETSSGNNEVIVTLRHQLIYPGEFKVFTVDADILKGEYVFGLENTFHETALPSFNDDKGSVTLLNDRGVVIDSMHYSAEMHSPFIREPQGVSLERVTFSLESKISNWRSATSTCGFATPGYANSNTRTDTPVENESVTITPEILQQSLSPRDFAQIHYRFDQGGLMANVRVFDQRGRPVKRIADNELLGAEGFFRWDGDTDDGSMAGTGYYLVWFEIFGAQGKVKTFKKRLAVY